MLEVPASELAPVYLWDCCEPCEKKFSVTKSILHKCVRVTRHEHTVRQMSLLNVFSSWIWVFWTLLSYLAGWGLLISLCIYLVQGQRCLCKCVCACVYVRVVGGWWMCNCVWDSQVAWSGSTPGLIHKGGISPNIADITWTRLNRSHSVWKGCRDLFKWCQNKHVVLYPDIGCTTTCIYDYASLLSHRCDHIQAERRELHNATHQV